MKKILLQLLLSLLLTFTCWAQTTNTNSIIYTNAPAVMETNTTNVVVYPEAPEAPPMYYDAYGNPVYGYPYPPPYYYPPYFYGPVIIYGPGFRFHRFGPGDFRFHHPPFPPGIHPPIPGRPIAPPFPHGAPPAPGAPHVVPGHPAAQGHR